MANSTLSSFAPVAAPGAKVLILGVMPGAESLKQHQYYAFKYNVFWRIMGEIFGFSPELPYPERLELLKTHRVALWDNLRHCLREGSLDSNIRAPEPNDVAGLLAEYDTINLVLCNGGASCRFFRRFQEPRLTRPIRVIRLPSTSPAAAAVSYADKLAAYSDALFCCLADSENSQPQNPCR